MFQNGQVNGQIDEADMNGCPLAGAELRRSCCPGELDLAAPMMSLPRACSCESRVPQLIQPCNERRKQLRYNEALSLIVAPSAQSASGHSIYNAATTIPTRPSAEVQGHDHHPSKAYFSLNVRPCLNIYPSSAFVSCKPDGEAAVTSPLCLEPREGARMHAYQSRSRHRHQRYTSQQRPALAPPEGLKHVPSEDWQDRSHD